MFPYIPPATAKVEENTVSNSIDSMVFILPCVVASFGPYPIGRAIVLLYCFNCSSASSATVMCPQSFHARARRTRRRQNANEKMGEIPGKNLALALSPSGAEREKMRGKSRPSVVMRIDFMVT